MTYENDAHSCSLHGSVLLGWAPALAGHAAAAPTVLPVVTVQFTCRERVPPPHVFVQDAQSDSTQSYLTHSPTPHVCIVAGGLLGQYESEAAKPLLSIHVTARVCVPEPHVTEHADQESVLYEYVMQGNPHDWFSAGGVCVQSATLVTGPGGLMALSTQELTRVCSPLPHVTEHAPH